MAGSSQLMQLEEILMLTVSVRLSNTSLGIDVIWLLFSEISARLVVVSKICLGRAVIWLLEISKLFSEPRSWKRLGGTEVRLKFESSRFWSVVRLLKVSELREEIGLPFIDRDLREVREENTLSGRADREFAPRERSLSLVRAVKVLEGIETRELLSKDSDSSVVRPENASSET